MLRGSFFKFSRIFPCFKKLLIFLICFGCVYYVYLLFFSTSNDDRQVYLVLPQKLPPKTTEKARSRGSSVESIQITTKIELDYVKKIENKEGSLSDDIKKQDEMLKNAKLPICPSIEKNKMLLGHVPQAELLIEDLTEDQIAAANPLLEPGGEWRPSNCTTLKKVAIIIPYRDRFSHLMRLLNFLFPILQRQLLNFRFIVTEQKGDDLFNKGRIMNAAFIFAEKLGVDCVIFHDVDMFPQDDRTPYDCPEQPRHIGAFVSNLGYQLWYNELVGGVLALTMDDYRQINGYSNLYWAWGGEDDDMGKRLLSQNMTIERPNQQFARFSMLKHGKRKRTAPKLIYKLLESAGTRWETDGVNNTNLWNVDHVDIRPLYYHLMVNVGIPPKEWRSEKN
uniref:Beta-1,4-N-acetylgalactosaminyltransferase n=2 Tax=Panagrolaimus sp. JU765 TaxID=591449 RepID=A0AC34RD12_9BILA